MRAINLQTGVINAFAGNGNFGLIDGAAALSAPMYVPFGTSVEASGNVLILEVNYIQRVTLSDGFIHVVAGSDSLGYGGDGAAASTALFSFPFYIAAAPNGDIVISDTGNFRVRRIHGAIINTVAGTTIADNIPATTAFLNQPEDVVGNGAGGFVFPDTGDSRVRNECPTAGHCTTLWKLGVAGSLIPCQTGFSGKDSACDAQGNVVWYDRRESRIPNQSRPAA